jgi:Lycopene cyclase protein
VAQCGRRYQGAYGIVVEVESHPFPLDTMLFMDWRDDHTQVGSRIDRQAGRQTNTEMDGGKGPQTDRKAAASSLSIDTARADPSRASRQTDRQTCGRTAEIGAATCNRGVGQRRAGVPHQGQFVDATT